MTTLSHFSHCDAAHLATPGHPNKQQLRPKNPKENRIHVFISIHVDFFFGIIINFQDYTEILQDFIRLMFHKLDSYALLLQGGLQSIFFV